MNPSSIIDDYDAPASLNQLIAELPLEVVLGENELLEMAASHADESVQEVQQPIPRDSDVDELLTMLENLAQEPDEHHVREANIPLPVSRRRAVTTQRKSHIKMKPKKVPKVSLKEMLVDILPGLKSESTEAASCFLLKA
jgi:hypothetical protein